MVMSKLKEEIEKHFKLKDDELVTQSSKQLEATESDSERSKVQGIGKYYQANKKLTEGQRESLVRFLARNKAFNNN